MESWLLRNVGFYRSFLPFYSLKEEVDNRFATEKFSIDVLPLSVWR